MNEFIIGLCIGFLLTLLGGFYFSDTNVYPFSYEHAQELCQVNGGLKYLSEGHTRFASATCKNGAVFDFELNKVKENVEK